MIVVKSYVERNSCYLHAERWMSTQKAIVIGGAKQAIWLKLDLKITFGQGFGFKLCGPCWALPDLHPSLWLGLDLVDPCAVCS